MRRNIKQCSRGRSWSTPAGEFRWKRLGWPAGLVHAQHVTSWPIGQLLVSNWSAGYWSTAWRRRARLSGQSTLMWLIQIEAGADDWHWCCCRCIIRFSLALLRALDTMILRAQTTALESLCRRTASEIVRRWEAIRDAELIVDQCKPNRDTTEWKGADDVAVLNKTHPVLLQF